VTYDSFVILALPGFLLSLLSLFGREGAPARRGGGMKPEP
jgi:hypothetical protein